MTYVVILEADGERVSLELEGNSNIRNFLTQLNQPDLADHLKRRGVVVGRVSSIKVISIASLTSVLLPQGDEFAIFASEIEK